MKGSCLVILLISTCLISQILNCKCAVTTDEKEFKSSGFVFHGEVKSIKRSVNNLNNIIEFNIIKRWKGPYITSVLITTCYQTACCGYNFKQGNHYIVFARKSTGAYYTTDNCSNNRKFTEEEGLKLDALAREAFPFVSTYY
jgi:hypothetical protein